MSTTVPIGKTTQFLTGPETADIEKRDEPVEGFDLEEAEEEEMAELWAGDRGNQGA